MLIGHQSPTGTLKRSKLLKTDVADLTAVQSLRKNLRPPEKGGDRSGERNGGEALGCGKGLGDPRAEVSGGRGTLLFPKQDPHKPEGWGSLEGAVVDV